MHLSLNAPELFQIFVYKQRIFLLGRLVLFASRIKTFTSFRGPYIFVYVVIFDISVDLTFKMTERKRETNFQRKRHVRNITDEKKQHSHITDFLKLLYLFVLSLHSTQNVVFLHSLLYSKLSFSSLTHNFLILLTPDVTNCFPFPFEVCFIESLMN